MATTESPPAVLRIRTSLAIGEYEGWPAGR
jgi:hypothetical protein